MTEPTDLQAAIDAVNPNSTDEEWTRLLAEAMNAADEITTLREMVASFVGTLTNSDETGMLCSQ